MASGCTAISSKPCTTGSRKAKRACSRWSRRSLIETCGSPRRQSPLFGVSFRVMNHSATRLDVAAPPAAALTAPLAVTAVLAVCVPALLAYNLPPSATFLNQAAAVMGWGGVLLLLASALEPSAPLPAGASSALLLALGVLVACAIGAWAWQGLPASLALSSMLTLGLTCLSVYI